MTFPCDKGAQVALKIAHAIQANKDHLSEVDGLIGDGDHGINMNKGFTMFADKVGDTQMNLSEAFKTLSRILMSDIGGSMGPLYGTFFIQMSRKAKGKEELSKEDFAVMLNAARDGITELGGAKVGDKTLMDALSPAADAYQAAIDGGATFPEALHRMKAAAEVGRDSTKDLVAKLGRASRLGERSRGVLDAGATSCCLILCALADGIEEYLA